MCFSCHQNWWWIRVSPLRFCSFHENGLIRTILVIMFVWVIWDSIWTGLKPFLMAGWQLLLTELEIHFSLESGEVQFLSKVFVKYCYFKSKDTKSIFLRRVEIKKITQKIIATVTPPAIYHSAQSLIISNDNMCHPQSVYLFSLFFHTLRFFHPNRNIQCLLHR